MLKNLKHYYIVENLNEALTLLNDKQSKNVIVGGGTFLSLSNDFSIDGLIDIRKCNFNKIEIGNNGDPIIIGASVTVRELQKDKSLKLWFDDIIGRAAENYANALQRNRATIGGVLCSAFSYTELVSALIGLDASIVYEKSKQEYKISLRELYISNPQNTLKGAIIKFIEIPKNEVKGFIKCIKKTKNDIAIIGCVLIKYKSGDTSAAFYSVGNLPIYYSFDSSIKTDSISFYLNHNVNPIDDIRGSASYKKEMVSVLIKRLLEQQ